MVEHKIKDPVIFETNYNADTATKLNHEIEQHYAKNKKKQELLIEYPTVYVINDAKGKKQKYDVYVGETNDIQRRTLQHIDEDPKTREDFLAFNKSDNVQMFVIGHEHFNKSLTLDIENRLMQYLSGSPAVHHLNNRRHNEQNKYYDSKELRTIFDKIWVNLNKKNKDLFPAQEIIESSALFKASPFNKLTNEQIAAKNQIINTINKALVKEKQNPDSESQLILVKGMAGSGKTVLMSNIFYDLINENQLSQEEDENQKPIKVSFIVNQKEQLTVYQQIAEKLEIGNKKTVLKPSTFIDRTDPSEKVDIAIIDEAHLLLTQNNQAFKKKYGKNMLKCILDRAKIVVAVFDPMQVLTTTAVWDEAELQALDRRAGQENIITLHNQMRIQASQETVNWLENLINNGVINRLPKDDQYQVKVFDSPRQMQETIKEKNKIQDKGISRMVVTFDWKYSGGKEQPPEDQHYWEVSEGDWSMPWNYEKKDRDHYENKHRSVKYNDLSWAEKDYTIDEIGSTYTVQGFDLNYVGVEIGPSVKYRDGKIIHDPSASANSKAIQKRDSTKSYAEELLKNEFNVLMTRGVHGLYLHAVDPELQKALKKAIKS